MCEGIVAPEKQTFLGEEQWEHEYTLHRDTKFNNGQHGQKEVYGLVQSRVNPDDGKNGAIS